VFVALPHERGSRLHWLAGAACGGGFFGGGWLVGQHFANPLFVAGKKDLKNPKPQSEHRCDRGDP